jgi:Arc/MetJ family transcription regulator
VLIPDRHLDLGAGRYLGERVGIASKHQPTYVLMMRTTLSLDDDVAAQLERFRRKHEMSLKELINDALRRGLREMNARSRPREPFNMKTFDMGGPRVDIDNIAEALAYAEGEGFK